MASDDVGALRVELAAQWERLEALEVVEAAEQIVRSRRHAQLMFVLAEAVHYLTDAQGQLDTAQQVSDLMALMASEQQLCRAQQRTEAIVVNFAAEDDAAEAASSEYRTKREGVQHAIHRLQLALNHYDPDRLRG